MNLQEKVNLAEKLQKSVAEVIEGLWPGFEPVNFILYDGESRAAVGEGLPPEYRRIRGDVWAAEGTDPQLMANTAIKYHGKMTAIWDVRTSAPGAAGIIHEMFHAFQGTALNLPNGNELLMPRYPHSSTSVKLVLAENNLYSEILRNPGEVTIDTVKAIAALRKLRKDEIGAKFMEYDDGIEGYEGTSAYVECKVDGDAKSYLPVLEKFSLSQYRYRCYSSGLALCLAMDALCSGWKSAWPKSGKSLFEWLEESLGLADVDAADAARLNGAEEAEKLLTDFISEKERSIARFKSQPFTVLEGDVQLLGFDPMNLVCLNDECLHLQGKIRHNGADVLLNKPFLTEIGANILEIRKVFVAE